MALVASSDVQSARNRTLNHTVQSEASCATTRSTDTRETLMFIFLARIDTACEKKKRSVLSLYLGTTFEDGRRFFTTAAKERTDRQSIVNQPRYSGEFLQTSCGAPVSPKTWLIQAWQHTKNDDLFPGCHYQDPNKSTGLPWPDKQQRHWLKQRPSPTVTSTTNT